MTGRDKRIEEFIENATIGILNSQMKEEAGLELLDHICTKIELKCMTGVAEEEAIQEVLASMGDENEIKEDFSVVYELSHRKGIIVCEGKGGQCLNLAKRLSKQIGIPYDILENHPKLNDEEVLVIIKRAKYGKACSDELVRYIKNLNSHRLKNVLIINTVISNMMWIPGTFEPERYGYRYNIVFFRKNNENYTLLKKYLREKQPDITIDDKIIVRNILTAGKINRLDSDKIALYLERMLLIGPDI